jgi:hypothetical protein
VVPVPVLVWGVSCFGAVLTVVGTVIGVFAFFWAKRCRAKLSMAMILFFQAA